MRLNSVELGSPLVWHDQFIFDVSKLEHNISQCHQKAEDRGQVILEIGDAKSTARLDYDDQPHNNLIHREFLEWLNPKVFEVFGKWNYRPCMPEITKSWYNSHFNTGETGEHNHHLTHLVISCYLKVPENSGRILFRDPVHDLRSMEPHQHGSNPWIPYEVKTNDVLFFPGWLYHKTEPSKSNDERIVMTLNIKAHLL